MIRDRNPMGVATEIIEHLLRSAKGSLRIDDPLLVAGFLDETIERGGLREGFKFARKLKLTLLVGLLQIT